jgi:hypothetical protein
MRSWTSWQDWTDLVLGIWLFLSPWFVGGGGSFTWNAWLLGAASVVVTIWALAAPRHMAAEVIVGLFGIWLFLTPWLFGFSSLAGQAWNMWIVGILFVALPIWRYTTANSAY